MMESKWQFLSHERIKPEGNNLFIETGLKNSSGGTKLEVVPQLRGRYFLQCV